MSDTDWTTAGAVLRLTNQLLDGIGAGLVERGYHELRPVHGFVFLRLTSAPVSTSELARYLGMTKQAAAEIVRFLVERGYLDRVPNPQDKRERLVMLTERGRTCTRAADEALAETVGRWRAQLTREQYEALRVGLGALAGEGEIRPLW